MIKEKAFPTQGNFNRGPCERDVFAQGLAGTSFIIMRNPKGVIKTYMNNRRPRKLYFFGEIKESSFIKVIYNKLM